MFDWLKCINRERTQRIEAKHKRSEKAPSVQFVGIGRAIASAIKEENAKEVWEYNQKRLHSELNN
jgi:hypothetical protein